MSGHIVVGYTATDTGKDAVALGARLAAASGSAMDLVVVLPSDGRSVITPPDASYDRYLEGQAAAWLEAATAEVPEGIPVSANVRYADSFAEGLLADVYDDPFLAAYRPEWAPDSGRIPAQTRAVGVDDLLQGVLGRTTAVCVSDTGVVSAAPWGATLISGDGAAVVSRYDRGAVPPADTTPARPQSLLDTLGGVSRIVEGIFSGLTS